MVRKLILATAVAAIGIAGAVAFAVPALANGDFYMQLSGTSLYLNDAGHNNKAEVVGSRLTYYTEVPVSGGWFEMEDNSGLCLNAVTVSGNVWVYSDSCNASTVEQWYKSGYLFENRHYGEYLTALPSSGEPVFLGNGSGYSQWGTPGV